jgi:glutaredoxin-related protein
MRITLTEKEKNVLMYVKGEQAKPRHSCFTSKEIKTVELRDIVSSLVKKGMIYDSYANNELRLQMWCLTDNGVQQVGIPKSWL